MFLKVVTLHWELGGWEARRVKKKYIFNKTNNDIIITFIWVFVDCLIRGVKTVKAQSIFFFTEIP